jgi:hypothetical protein
MSESVSNEVRAVLKDIVDATSKTDDHAIAISALSLAVHFFCEATGYEHESFIKNLNHLKERQRNES